LRTPITAILTAGENIRDGLVLEPDSLFEQGSVITDQASRLMELVDQVLLFAATSTARPTHSLRELQVDHVIADAVRSTKGLLEQAGFTLEAQIEPALPPITGDLSLLSQCLQNLIANAVKYSPDNRWVGISARINEEDREIQISVQDCGIGIPASDLAHIFLGGELNVSTQLGVGSVFTVRLPFANESLHRIRMAPAARTGT